MVVRTSRVNALAVMAWFCYCHKWLSAWYLEWGDSWSRRRACPGMEVEVPWGSPICCRAVDTWEGYNDFPTPVHGSTLSFCKGCSQPVKWTGHAGKSSSVDGKSYISPTTKEEAQTFSALSRFWRQHILHKGIRFHSLLRWLCKVPQYLANRGWCQQSFQTGWMTRWVYSTSDICSGKRRYMECMASISRRITA